MAEPLLAFSRLNEPVAAQAAKQPASVGSRALLGCDHDLNQRRERTRLSLKRER